MSNFKEGDIVVSLIEQNTGNPTSEMLKPGDIRCAYGENQSIWFKADGKGAYSSKNFRRASELEKEQFQNGITNIEYWVRKWPSGTLTMGCKVDKDMFKSLEMYNNEGGVQKYGTYGSVQGGGYPHKLATQEQIEYFNKHETLTTFPKTTIHEFKRGGWYRTIGTQFTTNKYIKFFIFDDVKKVVYSERITHAGEHHTFKAEHNYQCSSIAHPTESLVLVPDEEVAEYINKIINSFPIY